MAGDQTNNLVILDASDPFLTRTIEPSDNIQIGASVEIQNNLTVTGNLVAQSITSIKTEELRVNDNHILLNDGYTTAVAQTAGLVANYLPTSTNDSVNGSFTAGVIGVGNPTVVTAGSGTFSAGQFILIAGAANEANNGLYEVLSHVGTLLTIRGVGTVSTVEDFTEEQFVTDSTVQGTITVITLSVLRSGTDGAWEVASGSSAPLSFQDIALGTGAGTLQDAYDNETSPPATITTDGTNGSVIISGTESLRVTATGGLDVDTIFDFDGTSFDVSVTGGSGYSLDATGASNVSTTGANLTLSTITSGDVNISSAADVDVDGASIQLDGNITSNFTVTGNSGSATNINLSATNAGAGAASVNISSDDEVDITTTLIDINGNVDIDGTTHTIDATGALSFDAGSTANLTSVGELTLNSTTGNVDIDAATDFSIDGIASSTVTVTGASASPTNLTLSATNGGAGTAAVIIEGESEVEVSTNIFDLNAGDVDIDSTGPIAIDGTAISIDGTSASNITVTGADLTLSATGAGAVDISSGADAVFQFPNSSATALTVEAANGDDYIIVDTSDQVVRFPQGILAAQLQTEFTAGTTVSASDLLAVNASGEMVLADANAASFRESFVAAVSAEAATASNPVRAISNSGVPVTVRFSSAPSGTLNGLPVFLSDTAGQASMTQPSGSGTTIFKVGILIGADGATATPEVIFQPQYIARRP